MRTVAYLWIPLPEGSAAPKTIEHRVELDVLRQSGSVHVTVDGASTSVSKDSAVVLDPPLRGGPWVAIYARSSRAAIVPRLHRGRPGAHTGAVCDRLIRLPAGGAMQRDGAPRPADWNGYGSEVWPSPTASSPPRLDDIADTDPAPTGAATPITIEKKAETMSRLALGHERYAFYEHLKHGSIAVKAGDRVKRGQMIGRLGNSGSSSIGPHLHFHVSDASSPVAAEGLPFVFKRFDQLGAFRSIEALVSGERWLENGDGRTNANADPREAGSELGHPVSPEPAGAWFSWQDTRETR